MMNYNRTRLSSLLPTHLTGMTPIEATAFLRQELPEVKTWMYLHFEHARSMWPLSRICGSGGENAGLLGPSWLWERVPTAYPTMAWGGDLNPSVQHGVWVGAIRIFRQSGESFILFS